MAEGSRPTTPTQDLWSSILDSVSSSRSIPSKQVLLLGEPQTGKSTIAAALLQKPLDSEGPARDFALGYDWADIRDEADEDTLARLSVYTVPSSSSSYLSLLPHLLPPKSSLSNTVVMIVLDWTKPWTFIDHLELWLSWVTKWTKGDGSRELEVVRDEGRERLQSHLQRYTEPSAESEPLTTAAALATDTLLPLGQGTFTHNPSGIPIIVVCAKADLIDDNDDIVGAAGGMGGMVKAKSGEWEERTDSIMQVLRTICLKYGAALFYTTPQPTNQSLLRKYALHLLFMPPPPTPAIGTTEAPAPLKNPFPFPHRPNALDRDKIVIPAGWDSWGKIAILREGFEAARWGEAWERDLEDGAEAENGAKAQFTALVGGDHGMNAPPLPPLIQPIPEQTFLQRHHETLSKDPARDPRASFRQPSADGAPANSSGVVGPMGSSSFSLPSVERIFVEMEGGGERPAAPGAKVAPRRDAARPLAASHGPGGGLAIPARVPGQPASPTIGAAPLQNGAGKTQHEVLHNFFQSLLSARGKDGAPGGPGAPGAPAATTTAAAPAPAAPRAPQPEE